MELLLSALLLGIVEGVTEFLPISSTGHLIIVNRFIGFEGAFANTFNVVIQLGAILSVVVYFWSRIVPWSRPGDPAHSRSVWDLWGKSLVAVVPALVIGAVLGDFVEEKLFNPVVVGIALLLGGIILLVLESRNRAPRFDSVGGLPLATALLIGLIQCLAMVPGTSRSAATILGAMALGTSRALAAEFSFFLAVPTMTAASAYSILKLLRDGTVITHMEWTALAVGFIVSFLVAWAVIAAFMKFIQRHDFRPFAWYRVVLSLIVLAWLTWR